MLRSLYSGVSGVQNHQVRMDIVGNNIANVSTIGFKAGRGNFADAISQMLRPGQMSLTNRGVVNPVQVGLGVQLQSISNNFSQGSLESTGYATDLAIQGDGFFIVQGGDTTYYTRAGNFSIDAEGRMFAGNGIGVVQGRMANDEGVIENLALTNMTIPLAHKIPAMATSEVELYSNLDADATEADASLTDAGDTLVTSVAGIAADGLGGEHSVVITGLRATNSTLDSAAAGMTLATLLTDIGGGPNDLGDFTITVDDGSDHETEVTITGLDAESTLNDLLTKLNAQVNGVTFAFDDVAGTISITRDYAGDGAEYNVAMVDQAGATGVLNALFGVGATVNVNSGTASSLVATDTFTDAASGAVIINTDLTFVADPLTGLMVELEGLGGGGVTIRAIDGFAENPASPLLIETEATDHTTSISVYDEKGGRHNLSVTFIKSATQDEWVWEAEVGDAADAGSGATGTVTFNSDGSLNSWNYDGGVDAFTFDPGNGSALVSIAFDAGKFNSMNGITQTASTFSTAAVGQNGYAMGSLSDIDIKYDGSIVGNFTNGQELLIGQIVLADFANEDGLEKAGNNMWLSSEVSGDPRLSTPQTELGGSIEAGRLEMSNVDLVKEFTEMIKAQRGFQANARVITVSDQILQEISMLKR